MLALQRQTVSDVLWNSLIRIMEIEYFKNFRLVGGTSLSLQLGHRISVDIDLFTDSPYDSVDFNEIDRILLTLFPLVEMGYGGTNSMGKSYYVGTEVDNLVKLDMFYTDRFVFSEINLEGIRLSGIEEIAAMKLEIVGNGGRKKDFWDLHELMNHYSLSVLSGKHDLFLLS